MKKGMFILGGFLFSLSQNSNDSWSHKTGTGTVTNQDYSKKIIMDPRTCDRDNKGLHNYNLFVGYYAVCPLNTLCEKVGEQK